MLARYRHADTALSCGHTEHLQTEHGIIAIRPLSVKDGTGRSTLTWLIDFYDRSTDKPEDRDNNSQRFVNKLAAIRHILTSLNGEMPMPSLGPNDTVDVWANQAEREGCVLAVIGCEVLIEYEMPGTTATWGGVTHKQTSALRVVQMIQDKVVGNYKTMSYNTVPKRWLQAIREAGTTEWLGMGQRCTSRIPFPAE
jgi:hypothetical protein